MPTFLAELLSQVRGIWSRLDGGQRMTIATVAFAAVVGLSAIVWFAGQPDYETVFKTDDPVAFSDAANALGSAGVSFQEDGNALRVERSQSRQAMSALFRAGVTGSSDPEREESMSSVTQDSATRADKLMATNRRRAEHAVQKLDGVLSAYVTSSKPKRSVYSALDGENRASATVTIKLRSGESFSRIARAAVDPVASALGLPPQFVTVVDAKTKSRYTPDGEGHDLGGSDFLDQQRKRGRDLTERAQAWLDRLYDGRAIVTVTVDLDPTYTSSEEKIQPTKKAVLTEDTTSSKTPIGTSIAGGDPSVSAAASASGGGSEQSSKTEKRTYEPFSGVRRTGMLSPDIRRMTVALVLDESIDAGKHKDIEQAIKQTVGFLETRPSSLKDEFTTLVETFPEISEEEFAAAAGSSEMLAMVREFGPLAGQVLGVALVLLFLRRLLRAPPSRPASAGDGVSSVEAKSAKAEKDLEEELASLAPDERRRRMRIEIERSIADDPAAMSRMLEGWLAEQKA